MALFKKDAELSVPSLPEKYHANGRAVTPAKAQSRAVGPYANIGREIQVRGDVTGAEDLYIAGHLQGSARLPEHLITVGADGRAEADLQARNLLIIGQVIGSVTASECVEVEAGGLVDGELTAPRLIVHEGALLRGKVTVTGEATAQGGVKDTSATPDAHTTDGAGATPAAKDVSAT